MGNDAASAWPRIRACRSAPPGQATKDQRRAIFGAALEQSEQLFNAARATTAAARSTVAVLRPQPSWPSHRRGARIKTVREWSWHHGTGHKGLHSRGGDHRQRLWTISSGSKSRPLADSAGGRVVFADLLRAARRPHCWLRKGRLRSRAPVVSASPEHGKCSCHVIHRRGRPCGASAF